MKPNEFLNEDEDDVNPYQRVGRIKRQVIPTSHKASKLQDIFSSKNINRGDNVFVKEGDDYQHCVLLRVGEKGITVHNYKSGNTEWYDPSEVFQSSNRKMIPISGVGK